MSLGVVHSNKFGRVEKSTFSDEALLTTTEGLTITHSLCQASISLYGGHVLTWQPKEQKPVFWMSKASLFGNNKGIRGGVPLCFPWFGSYEADVFKHNQNKDITIIDKALIANHGFARTTQWAVDSVEITADFVKIILSQKGENRTPVWDVSYELKQELIFGESFSQSFIVSNKSNKAIEYTGALHSYFSVGKPAAVHIDQLSDVAYFDKLSGESTKISPLNNCEGPIDRVYQSSSKMNIVDKEWQRVIEVSSSDCGQWVLWNPGKKIADSMGDIHSGGENEYVCLEAANTTPVNIPAQSMVSFSQRVSLRSL